MAMNAGEAPHPPCVAFIQALFDDGLSAARQSQPAAWRKCGDATSFRKCCDLDHVDRCEAVATSQGDSPPLENELTVDARHIDNANWLIVWQRAFVTRLKGTRSSTVEAERVLPVYLDMLESLERQQQAQDRLFDGGLMVSLPPGPGS